MTRKPPSNEVFTDSHVLATGAHPRPVQLRQRPVPGDVGPRRVDPVAVNAAIRQLVVHPDPAVVFGHLAHLLVPVMCDEVTSVVEPAVIDDLSILGDEPGTPRRRSAGDADGDPARFTVMVRFNSGSAPLALAADVPGPCDYQMVLTCTWWFHKPTAPEVALIELLGRCAAGAVSQARQAAALRNADRHIDNLHMALNSNRAIGAAIGVLMTRKQLTYQQAFELLTSTSQRVNRKLANLADEVVLTGELPR